MYQTQYDEVLRCHSIFFEKQCHDSIYQFITDRANHYENRFIIYTYSNILEEIVLADVGAEGSVSLSFTTFNIGEFKAEKDFDQRFKNYLNSDKEWLFLKFDVLKETKHISMIKFKVDQFLLERKKLIEASGQGFTEENIRLKDKKIAMIIYLSKKHFSTEEKSGNKLESYFLSGWKQITIDCLNGGQISSIQKLLSLNTIDVVKSNLDKNSLTEMIFNLYLKFNFITYNKTDEIMVKDYMSEIIHSIENNSDFFELIINKCLDFLKNK
jgi:hypothetical protein